MNLSLENAAMAQRAAVVNNKMQEAVEHARQSEFDKIRRQLGETVRSLSFSFSISLSLSSSHDSESALLIDR